MRKIADRIRALYISVAMYALQASGNSRLQSSVLIHGLRCEDGASGDLGGAVHGLKTTKAGKFGVEGLLRLMTLEGDSKE